MKNSEQKDECCTSSGNIAMLAAALPVSTEEGNKLIALFMGMKCTNTKGGVFRDETKTIGKTYFSLPMNGYEPLQYNSSWDWIMPVAKKCISSYHDNRQDIFQSLHEVDIQKVWSACVEFIQWYNEFKPCPKGSS